MAIGNGPIDGRRSSGDVLDSDSSHPGTGGTAARTGSVGEGSLGYEVALCGCHAVEAATIVALHTCASDSCTGKGATLVVATDSLIHTHQKVTSRVREIVGEDD